LASEASSQGESYQGEGTQPRAADTAANPFVADFRPAGAAAEAATVATVLQGFLGDAPANQKRIYFSMELKDYAQFASADVIHRAKTSKENHPLGLEVDTVWLKESATIKYVPDQPPGGYGGLPAPYGGGPWAGAYRPYGGDPWAGAYGPYGGGPWAGAIGAYGGGSWAG
jgi:hypothetical protein